MAQETAGTIGIPVLKNEILPYMADYQRRRDRYAALEAQREAKLADLEYKRQQEQNKLTAPEMPTPTGGYFSKIISKSRTKLANELNEMVMAQKPQAEIYNYARLKLVEEKEKDARNAFLTSQLENVSKDLQQYGVKVTPGTIQSYVDQEEQKDPEFFNNFSTEKFTNWATTNPQLIDLSTLGGKIMEGAKETSIEIETPGGKKESLKYYDIFDVGPKEEAGKTVIGTKAVNRQKADERIASNPALANIRDSWIYNEAQRQASLPEISGLLIPQEEKNKIAVKNAADRFYNEAFKKYQTYAYGKAFDRTKPIAKEYEVEIRSSVPYAAAVPGGKRINVPATSISLKAKAKPAIVSQGTPAYNATTMKAIDAGKTGFDMIDLRFGYAAKDKTTGEFIEPKNWGNTPLNNVQLVPGVYGVKVSLQEKTGGSFAMPTFEGYGTPTVPGERVFVEEEYSDAENIAKTALKAKGQTYQQVMGRNLRETQKMFKTGPRIKKRK